MLAGYEAELLSGDRQRYIELSDKPGADSQEIKPGVVPDLDEDGNLVGLDIDQASKRVTLSRLEIKSLAMTGVA